MHKRGRYCALDNPIKTIKSRNKTFTVISERKALIRAGSELFADIYCFHFLFFFFYARFSSSATSIMMEIVFFRKKFNGAQQQSAFP